MEWFLWSLQSKTSRTMEKIAAAKADTTRRRKKMSAMKVEKE